jgi:hypothetical protein
VTWEDVQIWKDCALADITSFCTNEESQGRWRVDEKVLEELTKICSENKDEETRMSERVHVPEVSQKEDCLGISALQKLVSCYSTGINMVTCR